MRRITRIIDGDTAEMNKPVYGSCYVRLSNTNAPEYGEVGYYSAKRNFSRRFRNRRVWIRSVGRSYGRIVAKVRRVRSDRRW